MIEKGIRGGTSMISCREGVANNRYMDLHDPSRDSSYILYIDANNLYGWAISQPLPLSGFKWMTAREIERFNVRAVKDDAEEGYILEVDLDYPDHLHHSHNCYPLAVEKMDLTFDSLSPTAKELSCTLNRKYVKTSKCWFQTCTTNASTSYTIATSNTIWRKA